MSLDFDWSQLEKLEAAVAWRREAENAALANVWHLETIAHLTTELRRFLELNETDERLITLLWSHIPGDERSALLRELSAPGNRFAGGDERLDDVLSRRL